MMRLNDVSRSLAPSIKNRAVTDQASPFGCCNFFDGCTTEIFSLYYGLDNLDLLDWMGFVPTENCYKTVEFIEYVRAEQSQEGSSTAGYISDPCSDPNGIEIGSCQITVEDFGLYGRVGPTRNIFKPKYYCETRPRTYAFDGSRVTSEPMWDSFFITDQILNDVRLALVEGNATTAGQFDGLEQWVATDYDCQSLDSYVVNWNGNGMDGGAGITINGTAIAATFDIYDVLRDLVRRIRQRIRWSPLLANQNMAVGDMIIAGPTFLMECLLDFYTCWSVCPEAITTGTNDANTVNRPVREMRDFRSELNGGLFGDGRIFIDGMEIPILNYDWGTINGPTTGDMYVLTGSIGNQRIWEGQILDPSNAMEYLGQMDVGNTAGDFGTFGNYFLTKGDFDNLCAERKMWMAPRLFCYAPWAQIRFQDVVCDTPSGPLSPDPEETSFFITSSFTAAECP